MKGAKMPIHRDVSVKGGKTAGRDADLHLTKSSPGLVTVMGFDKNDVLFRSDKVGTVQWRDMNGNINALLVRLMPDDIWGFSRSGDSDWEEVLKIYGNPDDGS